MDILDVFFVQQDGLASIASLQPLAVSIGRAASLFLFRAGISLPSRKLSATVLRGELSKMRSCHVINPVKFKVVFRFLGVPFPFDSPSASKGAQAWRS
jgi:hypothetical protein